MLRSMATVIPLTGAESLGVPTLNADIDDPEWTTELAIGDEDTTLAFGKRRLTPHPVAKWIKVSKELLRSAAISVESVVRERLAYKFGAVQETAFMTGTGAGQPLGIFTASNSGISTSQDVSTGNTNTTITADGLINAKYGLEAQWLGSPSLRWIMHREVVAFIRKLKDGEGQYLWQPGLAQDRPDVILNVPVLVSEFAPHAFTTGKYLAIIGDLSYYWIADNMSLQIQRLVELYAATNQDAFMGRMALDGMPVLEKAFIRVACT
jgi:HK97 family phage major capsid protein